MMRSRSRRWIGLPAIIAAAGATTGCVVLDACPAVGYAYGGPAVVEFSPAVEQGVGVSACFGTECEPSAVTQQASGIWEVPQEPPFLAEDELAMGEIRSLRIQLHDPSGLIITDEVHDIPIETEPTGVFGQCPGPFSFGTLVVDDAS